VQVKSIAASVFLQAIALLVDDVCYRGTSVFGRQP
jgi:hypothetical protein